MIQIDTHTHTHTQALEFYQKAANGGHAKAHYRLGLIHEEGKCDVTADVGMAMKWFVAAALRHNFSLPRLQLLRR